MTVRERVLAAARGGEVDRKPVIAPYGGGDVLICDPENVTENRAEGTVVLARIVNPFGMARNRGINLNIELKRDPAAGAALLDTLSQEVRDRIEIAVGNGADGIFLFLEGATPEFCSPMQYGGYYLERDRDLLTPLEGAFLNVLYVPGGDGVFLDFVSDLPATVFAWDADASGFRSDYVRRLRNGAQASTDPDSEFLLDLTSGVPAPDREHVQAHV